MPDGVEVINELAEKAAAEIKEKEQQQQQSQETPEAKLAREAQEAEKLKQQAPQETPEQKTAREAEEQRVANEKAEKEKKSDVPVDPIAELLKETKFESKEALLAHLNKKDKKVESPEEKKRSEEVYRANLNKFAVENELLSNEDIVKLETLKQKADKDLVFERFASEVRDEITDDEKELNADVTEEEIEAKIKEAFEKEYPLNSKNQKAKTRAENKLAKEAKELRGPLESSFTEAKSRYDTEVSIRNNYEPYLKSVNGIIEKLVPSVVPFFKDKDGEEEIPIDVPISKEDRKAIIEEAFKKVSNDGLYNLFTKDKLGEAEEAIKDQVEYLLWKKYGELGKKEIATKFMSRGITKGSDIGAKQSFATNQAKAGVADKPSPADAEQQVIDSTRQKS